MNADKSNKYSSVPEVLPDDEITGKKVVMKTNKGTIEFELYGKESPLTVSSFIFLVKEKFYDTLTFHRVISGFMIQGGDPLGTGTGGPGYQFIDEINAHKVDVGSVAMANSGPSTNGSQFFIVTESAQPHLDGLHTVFGKVTSGMDIVLKIEQGDVIEKVTIEDL
ncbi:MAG TPA: peptidylprolyl isomerase [bacterium]|nr:peptidylprolyl isomerase [bacterium]